MGGFPTVLAYMAPMFLFLLALLLVVVPILWMMLFKHSVQQEGLELIRKNDIKKRTTGEQHVNVVEWAHRRAMEENNLG